MLDIVGGKTKFTFFFLQKNKNIYDWSNIQHSDAPTLPPPLPTGENQNEIYIKILINQASNHDKSSMGI